MISKKSVKLSPSKLEKLAIKAFERDKYCCQIETCLIVFSKKYLAPHHIIPRGRLRLDILENILTTCKRCHRLLHDNLLSVTIDDLIDKYNLRGYLQ